MSEVKLLPLPELHLRYGHFAEDALAYATDYARANMEPLIDENERLRAKYQRAAESSEHFAARAERLAEALRKTREDINWMLNNRQFLNSFVFDYIDAALDQEGGNG